MSDLSSLLIELVCCVAVIILINLRCTMEQRVQLPSPNKKRLSLSLLRKKKQGANSEDSVAKRPRFECASTSEFETASKKFVPKNTCASLKWAFSLFTEWIAHNEREENGRRYKSEDLWLCQDPERLVTMLSLFFMEVRQRNGKPYTPKSLLQILTNLYKHASTIDSGCLPFMSAKDSRFQHLHTVLDNTSCQLHKEGIGVTKVQARVVTTTEENCLWDTGVIATDSPTSLLNGVFFYCGLYLCLRGGGEHRSIKYSQFAIKTVVNPNDPSEMIKCLVYTEHGSKIGPVHVTKYILITKKLFIMPMHRLVIDVLSRWWKCTCLNCHKKQLKKICSIASLLRILRKVCGTTTAQLVIIY